MQAEPSEARAPVRKRSRVRRLTWAVAFGVVGPLFCFGLAGPFVLLWLLWST